MLANTLAKKVEVSRPHIFQIFYKIDSQFTRTFRQSFFCPSSDLYTPLLKPGKCSVKCHSPELDVSFMHIYVGKEIFNVSRICWAILNTYVYMQKNVGKKSRKLLNWVCFRTILNYYGIILGPLKHIFKFGFMCIQFVLIVPSQN